MNENENDPAASFSYLAERDQALDHNRCFLCGADLREVERTDEHIFPRWMLRDFDLYDEQLNLLNGTTIRYRALTIPCCDTCNTWWLQRLEAEVSVAVRQGVGAVATLPPLTLSLWMTKIYYGILFKELGLALDRADPESDPIVDPKLLEQLATLHWVLQAARRAVVMQQVPASVPVQRLKARPGKPTRRGIPPGGKGSWPIATCPTARFVPLHER